MMKVSEKESADKQHYIRSLKNMIQDKEADETVEEILVKFCARNAVSMKQCKEYYEFLITSGQIRE